MFGGEIEKEEEPDDVGKSESKLHKGGMKKTFQKIVKHITVVEATVKGMRSSAIQKICPLRGHILIARSSLRSQV